jgi:hypothetical protein
MPKPCYRITAADVRVVHRWIRERLRNDAWPEDWPRLTAWDRFPYEMPTEKTLQRWCDRFLDAKQWNGCSPLGVYPKMAKSLNKIKALGGARGAVF